MQAEEQKLIDFLNKKQQLIIPIFQRPYSWVREQCQTLWEDIEKAQDDKIKYHFIGSIVTISPESSTEEVTPLCIIDGQQRITTILLLIIAITRSSELIEARVKELRGTWLINEHGQGNLKYKMTLQEEDNESLKNLIDQHDNKDIPAKLIKDSFNFFMDKIKKQEEPEKIYAGIRKLMIIDVSLDARDDDPQAIFESLNSTGLKLTQTDLIRNYILMGWDDDEKPKELYENYWQVMEKNFGEGEIDNKEFNKFMRDYLTIRNENGIIPKEDKVYETFKEYFRPIKNDFDTVKEAIGEVLKFSNHYAKIALGKEENPKLKKAFKHLKDLKVGVVYPFVLEVYDDFVQKIIDEATLLEILALVESFLFRRAVFGILTQGLNKIFPKLYTCINKEKYLESLQAELILGKTRGNKFPTNQDFKEALKTEDLYNRGNITKFWIDRLENYDRKELVNIAEYTIEHIMPQTISTEWENDLGKDWKEVHEKYLHTFGNLTLTGYNPEMSNKPFAEKKAMEGGFAKSPLRLNESVAKFDTWNEESIKQRAEILSEKMIEIWRYPQLDETILQTYENAKNKGNQSSSIDDHPFLNEGRPMKKLFYLFNTRVLNLDASVRQEVKKWYIAYKTSTNTNFVEVAAQGNNLRLTLNMKFDKIKDPKGICYDITDKNKWRNVRVDLSSESKLEDVMYLVKQAFDEHDEDN